MSVRATQSWLAWLLPLLILRAFVPVGFMLSWADGQLQMVLCAQSGPATMQMTPPGEHHANGEHAHHAHGASPALSHAQHEHQGSKAHEGSYCPFAVAATASAPIAPYALEFDAPRLQAFEFLSDPDLKSASVLIDRIRGPPRV